MRTCPRCRGPLRVVAYLTEPDAVRRVLDHLGLSIAAPWAALARGPPDPTFDWAHDEPVPDIDPPDLDELPGDSPDA